MFLTLLDEAERKAFYNLACHLVSIEGVTPDEEQILIAAKREMGWSDTLPLATSVDVAYECAVFNTEEAKKVVLLELMLLAIADGAFQADERQHVNDVVQHLAIDEDLIPRARDWAESVFGLYRTGLRFINADLHVPLHAVR